MRTKILFLVLAFLFVLPVAAHADFMEGKKSYDNKNWRRAIVHLRPLAEQGDARALVLLGNMYLEGYGVEKDSTEAFLLYHRAATRNNVDGMMSTATLYQTGDGVGANTRLAILWFERCAKMGNQSCAFFYAVHQYQGSKGKTFDLKPDHAAAYKWFKIAARARGNPKMAKAADVFAEKLRAELNYKDIEALDLDIVNWQPTAAQDLGPLPEDIVNAEGANEGGANGAEETDAASEPQDAPAADAPASDASPEAAEDKKD